MPDRLEQLQKLYERDQTDTFVTYAMAMEHGKAERMDEALEWLDRTIALDADHAYAYFQKGKMLMAQGKTDQAKAVLDAGVEAAKRGGDDKGQRELSELRRTLG